VYGDSKIDQVDALFEKWDKPTTPGCALGIIQNGEFVYKRGYGIANLEFGIPNSETTVFRTGSVSKQFTTMSIVLAAAKGKLSLDDDIRKHIPEMPEYERTVTIKHLIHHTSGIRDYLVLMRLAGKRDEDYYTNEEVLEALARLENLNFTPGSEYTYSNAGYWLLSQIIERATGKSLRVWAHEEMFVPLGMKQTHFHDDPRMIVPNRASGYRPKEDGGFEIDMTPLEMVGDGGVFTTINDLLEWDRNFDAKTLGGEAVMTEMLTPGRFNNGKAQDYAGGLWVRHYREIPIVEHGGTFVGFKAGMIRFPEQGFSAYCLCNVSEARPMERLHEIADIYLDDHFREEEIETVSLPEDMLQKHVGTYWDGSTHQLLEIELDDGRLNLVTGGRPAPLLPLSEKRFITDPKQTTMDLEFREGRPGEPLRVEVAREGQRSFEYERVQAAAPSLEELEAYAGVFYCRELDATYRVKLGDDDQLVVTTTHFPEEALQSIFPDAFRYEYGNVVFERNAEGDVTGFRLSTGRARNFEFVRREATGQQNRE
jgi:CubicO group peptidase (beta-lactamase class C family)